ncbi:hypothetical protein [Geothrix sp. 21YS21S-2]|uniref:hypothetical protein n=1 Tax=Geothrix sp. 21YS21S-2 TaxID=3068893 RepID=UPI0027B95FF3|nr:hypothetical protein [Geothrix sp. 21YS21S-2]
MGLPDFLEKLVIEHGSAAVSKERIELLKERMTAQDKRVEDLQVELERFRLIARDFELENYRLKDQIEELEGKLQRSKPERLESELEDLLLLVAEGTITWEDGYLGQVPGNHQVARYRLDELTDLHLVSRTCFTDGRVDWDLNHEGRKYLIVNKLIC